MKVYRLITRNSYEREMFDKASLKLGLDKAVLQSMSGREGSIAGVSAVVGGGEDWLAGGRKSVSGPPCKCHSAAKAGFMSLRVDAFLTLGPSCLSGVRGMHHFPFLRTCKALLCCVTACPLAERTFGTSDLLGQRFSNRGSGRKAPLSATLKTRQDGLLNTGRAGWLCLRQAVSRLLSSPLALLLEDSREITPLSAAFLAKQPVLGSQHFQP